METFTAERQLVIPIGNRSPRQGSDAFISVESRYGDTLVPDVAKLATAETPITSQLPFHQCLALASDFGTSNAYSRCDTPTLYAK